MINPIYQLRDLNTSFTYFHTHVVDQKILDAALESGKNIEIDVSMDGEKIYVGHPLSFYRNRGLPNPTNVPLDNIVAQAQKHNIYLVFDCKNVNALPKIQELIKKYGADKCLLHAFVKELSIKPWPPKIVQQSEENWPEEELPLGEVLKVKHATRVPVVLSCHGITLERLRTEEDKLLQAILQVAKGKVESVNLFLPKDETMPLEFSKRLLGHSIIPLISDRVPQSQRPKVYLGTSDDLSEATTLSDFL